jgi:hypothetical protein
VPPVTIENPILNAPFDEPTRHFRFSDLGITDQIVEGRRESGYFLPIASPRKKSGQLRFETEWTGDRFLSSPRINRIRARVAAWRQGGYVVGGALIVEVSGEGRKDKAAKVNAEQTLWVPAVNNHGGFGRWAFVEVTDPWDARNTIKAALAAQLQSA